jgi:hypothetical protein
MFLTSVFNTQGMLDSGFQSVAPGLAAATAIEDALCGEHT